MDKTRGLTMILFFARLGHSHGRFSLGTTFSSSEYKMADRIAFESQGLPSDIGSRAQNIVAFLNTGGEPKDLIGWRANHDRRLEQLGDDWTTVSGKPKLAKRLSDLITLLDAQSAIIEEGSELLARKSLWTPEDLNTARTRTEQLWKKHWLATKLRQRILLEELERKLVTSEQETRHNAWKALYTAYRNVNERTLLEPCLNRVHEMLVQMWPAATQLLVERAEAPSSLSETRFFWSELRWALERFADLVPEDNRKNFAEYAYTTALRDRLNEQLHPKEEPHMSRQTQPGIGTSNVISIADRSKTLTGNHTAATKDIPTMTNTDQEQQMKDFAAGSFSDPIRVRDALTLAKPFLTDPDKAKTDGEKALLARLNTFRENTVDRLERMSAGPGPWRKNDLDWAVANKAILVAALPFFRGDAAVQTLTKRLEREPLTAAIDALLDLPEGGWTMEQRKEASALVNHVLVNGTAYEGELKTRLATEEQLEQKRRAEVAKTPDSKPEPKPEPTIVAKTTPPVEDALKIEVKESAAAPWGPIVTALLGVMALIAVLVYMAVPSNVYRRQSPSPVTPTDNTTASSPVTPTAPVPPAPAGSLRALTPADFGGNPVNRVPATVVVPGSWAGDHLRCTSSPITDGNGNTDYSGCQYAP